MNESTLTKGRVMTDIENAIEGLAQEVTELREWVEAAIDIDAGVS